MVHGHSFHHGKTAAALSQILKNNNNNNTASIESQRAKDGRRTHMEQVIYLN